MPQSCLCGQHPPTYPLIFMDVNMPIKDGIEATKEILELTSQLDEAPYIVALTAY
jgi:CheY-like chemotaxis protein